MKRLGFYISLIFAIFVVIFYNLRHHHYMWKIWVVDDWVLGFLRYMLLPWIVTLLIALTGYVIGAWILNFLERKGAGGKIKWISIERPVYATAIGMGIISIVTFIIGWLHLIYSPIYFIAAIAILAVGFKELSALFRNFRKPGFNFLHWTLFTLIGLWIFRTVFLTGNPSIGCDAISSHLAAAKWYLNEHAVAYNFVFSYHQFQGMLLTIQMMFLRDPGSTLTYFFMLGSAAMIYLIARRCFNRTTGLLAVLIFLLQPISFFSSQQTLVDHGLAFYLLLMMHAVLMHDETRDNRWLYLAGIAGGMACGIKFNALVPCTIMVLMAGRKWWRVFIPVVIVGSPWYIANIFTYGNPLYPYYESLFGWTQSKEQEIRELGSQLHRPKTYEIGSPLLAWWNLTFQSNMPWSQEGEPGRIGPFLLAFTPALIFVKWKRPAILLGIFILAVYAYWFLYEQFYNARYMMYVFTVHGILAAWGITQLFYRYAKLKQYNSRNKWHLAALAMVFIIFLVFGYSVTLKYSGHTHHYTKWDRQKYIHDHKPGYLLVDMLNRDYPEARVFGAGCDDYLFYADFEMLGSRWGPNSLHDFRDHGVTSEELHHWLTSLGCEWLLYNPDGLKYHNFSWSAPLAFNEDKEIFSRYFHEVELPPEYQKKVGNFKLYQLK